MFASLVALSALVTTPESYSNQTSWLCTGNITVQQMGGTSMRNEVITSSITVYANKLTYDVEGFRGEAKFLDKRDIKSVREYHRKMAGRDYTVFYRDYNTINFTIHVRIPERSSTIDVFLNENTGQFQQTLMSYGRGRMYNMATICQKM
jgi:hypothetical protein